MNQELLTQLLALLEASNSFKIMEPEQQAAIKESFQNATDEQIAAGIEALKADQLAAEKAAAEDKEREEKLIQDIGQIKTAIKEEVKTELKQAEAADEAATQQEMQGVMQELNISTPTKEAPKADTPKRKKFLGIF